MVQTMKILINSKEKSVPPNTTVAALLSQMEINARYIAVELNGIIVDGQELARTVLQPGDKVEIVRFLGGG